MANANAVKTMTYARSHNVTMSAGTSSNQKRMGLLSVALLLVGLVAPVMAQTGQVMPPPKFEAFDANGDPCSGCKLFSYAAGTTTKQDTYTTAAINIANANPVVLDTAGRATVFVNPAQSYKFVLAPAADTDPPADAIYTVDNVVGPFSGVVSVTAANTRGVQISRAGAEAGLSIASTGGSGKTYGIVSNTSGGLRIQDDSDATPRIEILADAINLTTAGNVNVPTGGLVVTGGATVGGAFGVGGATILTGTLAANGAVTTTAGVVESAAIPRISVNETDGAVDNRRWTLGADAERWSLQTVNDAASSSVVVFDVERTGTVVDSITLRPTAVLNTGRYHSATLQPGFLAYNSALDSVATGSTVDFDTEVYDDGGNFSADTFTAPVTGRYHFCVVLAYEANAAASYGLRLVTTARTYQIFTITSTTIGVSSACTYADMAASATAFVQVLTGDAAIDISGGASPMVTYFSGRLVP